MEQFALGQIGLNPDNFYLMTLRSFDNLTIGWNEKQKNEYQNGWEQTRLLGYIIARSQGSKCSDVQKFIPFEWDKKKIASEAEWDKFVN